MILHGTGCCLIDFLYASVDYSSPAFEAARSNATGDGGLMPGRLVFAEDFERFAGVPYERALAAIVGGKAPDAHNLGGPSIVSLAHAAHLREGNGDTVRFFGVRGDDRTGDLVAEAVSALPLDEVSLSTVHGPSPRTDVLSDPAYDHGRGERTFIDLLGVASRFGPRELDPRFHEADVVALGGTGLVPGLHDGMTEILEKAARGGAATVVNLVYDFRGESLDPGAKWRLGARDDAYPFIDLLVADREEAVRTSGTHSVGDAIPWFLARGVGAVVVTDGAGDVRAASRGGLFRPMADLAMPISAAISGELASFPARRGDTTGCGDNFAGGLLASILEQLRCVRRGSLDLREACMLAVPSGGFACFTVGGTFRESYPGEKRKLLAPYLEAYRKQVGAARA